MGESLRSAAGVTGPDANAVYPLGSSLGESARLQRQAEELAADSAALLDRVGLRPGQSAIDLGCGPRGILDMLAGRVSPAGRVVGLDADPAHAAMAAEFAAARGLSGVEIITADARSTGLPAGSFDLVHARTLLVNLAEPAEVAAEMMRLARPGGWVASMEPDTEHALCYPPHPAFDRLRDIFTVAFRRNGADPWIGRRVPELFRRAGLEDVQVEARVQMYPPGNSRRTVRLDLVRAMRPQVVQMGLATAAELDELEPPAPTCRTPEPSSCPACFSWPGAANQILPSKISYVPHNCRCSIRQPASPREWTPGQSVLNLATVVRGRGGDDDLSVDPEL